MSKSTSLPYAAPFRYTPPTKDVHGKAAAQAPKAVGGGAKVGKAGKSSSAGKKQSAAATRKPKSAGNAKVSKPAATKTKKPARKR